MTSDPREQLGRLVRETWVACAEEAGDTKPSHLTGWDDLDEDMREVDMRIGEAVAAFALPDADPVPGDAGRDLRREALAVAYTAGRAAERERIRQQSPVCTPMAPPNVLCMECLRPLCRSCGACECPDNSESLCGAGKPDD